MRYGKSSAQEIDPTLRRKPNQKLKSAAPGAAFGWCGDGTPYIGTQYCISRSKNGLRFASLSTRNGGSQYFWKPLSGLSAKVALSALETHGCCEKLRANESCLPIGEVLDATEVGEVKKIFRRLVGDDAMYTFEAHAAAEAEMEAKPATAKKSAGLSVDSLEAESKAVGKKRLARMMVVDDIKAAALEDNSGAKVARSDGGKDVD